MFRKVSKISLMVIGALWHSTMVSELIFENFNMNPKKYIVLTWDEDLMDHLGCLKFGMPMPVTRSNLPYLLLKQHKEV